MSKTLAGQHILITGATGGIGAAIARQVATEGGVPLIHFCHDRRRADALIAECGGVGVALQADLAMTEGPLALWAQAVNVAGRIHGLVNNAGIRTEIGITASADDWHAAWRREFQVNFFAAADLCKEAIAHFQLHGAGRIVNMVSRAAERGYAADAMPYGASKAALMNLGKTIARSFGGTGVTAVNIAPGWVHTAMADAFIALHGMEAAVSDIPIREMASPEEIAELVAFVLRPSQVSLNGATLDANGGSHIR